MIERYKTQTNIGVLAGIVLQVAGRVIIANQSMGASSQGVGWLLMLVGSLAFIYGCWNYALGKGYPGPVGLLGLLWCLGLLILVFLPDKTVK